VAGEGLLFCVLDIVGVGGRFFRALHMILWRMGMVLISNALYNGTKQLKVS